MIAVCIIIILGLCVIGIIQTKQITDLKDELYFRDLTDRIIKEITEETDYYESRH